MTEHEARSQFQDILRNLGIERGDTVYLGIDMGRLPLPRFEGQLTPDGIRVRREKMCAFVLDVLRDHLGSDGTVLVPSFSYAYARHGTPYVHEESPSEIGPFTEFVRGHSEAIRSLHPLNSVSGIGGNAAAILENVGKAGYGVRSPFGRLGGFSTKFLCLGVTISQSLTYIHHMEHMYGVNHMYHKLYNVPVYANGGEIPGPWLCFVRYLGVGVQATVHGLEARMREDGTLREFFDCDYPMQSVQISDVERVGYAMLEDNPWPFLDHPVEVHMHAAGAATQPTKKPAAWYERKELHKAT